MLEYDACQFSIFCYYINATNSHKIWYRSLSCLATIQAKEKERAYSGCVDNVMSRFASIPHIENLIKIRLVKVQHSLFIPNKVAYDENYIKIQNYKHM